MPERGFTWRSALIALGAAALFIVGLAIVVYVAVARDRIGPTPTPRPTRAATATDSAPMVEITAVTATSAPLDTVAGVVREYSPGALIIAITPKEGTAEQIIVPENIEVSWSSGQRASPREVAAGQVLYAEGHLDTLGRLVAQRIVIIQAAPRLTATTAASPTHTAVPVVPVQAWVGEYWGNMTLAGKPTLTRYDAAIDFDWQHSAPAASLPDNGFSVRWRGRWPMEQGPYVFYAHCDDGVRVWVDGVVVIDAWRDQAPTQLFGEVELARGEHVVQVEYYENADGAEIQLWWELKNAFSNWKGEYYGNVELKGLPLLTRNDNNVSFDWGAAAPAAQVPADSFSVRWTRSITVEEGAYRFKSRSDDGVRVWVDERLLIDAWSESNQETYEGYIWMSAAPHQVRIEYYEGAGSANVHVWWERIGAFAQWRGEYLPNAGLTRPPIFVRNDFEILFDWKLGSPGYGMPSDNFSARWTRRLVLDAGDYTFWAMADDAVRLYVDDVLLIDAWRDSSRQRHEGKVRLTAGEHILVVEYYERGGDASIQVAWEVAAPTPTATPSPLPTLTSTPPLPTATVTSAPPTETAPPPTSTATSEPPTPTLTLTPEPTSTATPAPSVEPTATPTSAPAP